MAYLGDNAVEDLLTIKKVDARSHKNETLAPSGALQRPTWGDVSYPTPGVEDTALSGALR
jgi:hypothetical protein